MTKLLQLYKDMPVYEKETAKALIKGLRLQLLQLQFQIAKQDKPVILVIAGDDRAGRHETINTLMSWLDPRFIRVNAYGPAEKLDEQKPFFWRYWRDIPAGGHIGIYMRAWTSTSVVQYLNDDISGKKLKRRLAYIRQFEKSLHDDGALVVKIWLHLSKDAHQERVDEIRDTSFFDPKDELALKNFDKAIETIDHVLCETHTKDTPWHVISGEDPTSRNIHAGQTILQAMQKWLARTPVAAAEAYEAPPPADPNQLDSIDLSPQINKEEYDSSLKKYREQLHQLMNQAHEQGQAVVCVFEGVDAAGKGGAIRRVASAIDAGIYRIVPVAKPTDEEYAHHYLWRFWRHIPANGMMTIFDRSWYGRVLVERVEELATPEQWMRAYDEINDFEEQLTIHGIIVLKFWLHIDQDEQMARFKAREITPHKMHKITDEDYRNREKWPQYREAIHDMLEKTSSKKAPWTIIPAQDKKYARVEVVKTLVKALKEAL